MGLCKSRSQVYADGDRRGSRLLQTQDSVRLRKKQLANRKSEPFRLEDAVAMGERDGASLDAAKQAGEAVQSGDLMEEEDVPIKPFGKRRGGARDSVIINRAHLEAMHLHAAGSSPAEAAAAATTTGGEDKGVTRHSSFNPGAAGTGAAAEACAEEAAPAAAAEGGAAPAAAAEGEHAHVHFVE